MSPHVLYPPLQNPKPQGWKPSRLKEFKPIIKPGWIQQWKLYPKYIKWTKRQKFSITLISSAGYNALLSLFTLNLLLILFFLDLSARSFVLLKVVSDLAMFCKSFLFSNSLKNSGRKSSSVSDVYTHGNTLLFKDFPLLRS